MHACMTLNPSFEKVFRRAKITSKLVYENGVIVAKLGFNTTVEPGIPFVMSAGKDLSASYESMSKIVQVTKYVTTQENVSPDLLHASAHSLVNSCNSRS